MTHLAAGVLVQHLHGGAGPDPVPSSQFVASVTIYLAVTFAGLLAAPILTGVPGRPAPRRWTLTVLAVATATSAALTVRVGATWP
ncbi:MAG TPA: hypothetical protein VKJ07_09335, partial [Mycobacteriales bacterium]|nr:hypothetical protein [Mycobacteriales bacterium]